MSLRGPYWNQKISFYKLINDTENCTECMFSNMDDIKLNGVVDMSEGKEALQKDLEMFEKWVCLPWVCLPWPGNNRLGEG